MRMNVRRIDLPVFGIFAVAALALAVSAGGQTTPAAKTPQATPMAGHQHSAASAGHDTGMKAECQAMMAKKQEMQDKQKAMDATLDKLVADMNTAGESSQAGAMEKPMAAVINELVAQHKASHAMMAEMQPEMMAHMMRHMDMHGAKAAMECPMMKAGKTPPATMEKKMPNM